MGEGGFVPWEVSCKRGLRQSEEFKLQSLLSLLTTVFICREDDDVCI